MGSRKFAIDVCSVLPTDASGIYESMSKTYVLIYVGIYSIDDGIRLYVHCKNVIRFERLESILRSLEIGFSVINTCKVFTGQRVSEYGTLVKNGRPHKERKVTPTPPHPVVQPPTSLPDPVPATKKRANNCIIIHEDIYVGRTFGAPSLDMFHAVWSSVNGLWSPAMWVGPIRNIVVSKRVSPKHCDVTTLYKNQGNRCRLCRTEVFTGTYSNSDVDHIVPLMYGGSSSLSNLQVLCVTCHRRKTALECKKVVTSMGDSGVDWGSKVYLVNSHVHHLDDPGSVPVSTPREFLDLTTLGSGGSGGSRAGLCVLLD